MKPTLDESAVARLCQQAVACDYLAGLVANEALTAAHHCDSPIETKLLAATMLHFRMLGAGAVPSHLRLLSLYIHSRLSLEKLDAKVAEAASLEPIRPVLVAAAQVQIGGYRVDICLDLTMRIARAGPRVQIGRLIVECDGAAFHDATVEQLRRDRGRDRDLQVAGLHVMRFTGGELHHDPFGCAGLIEEWFVQRLEDARAEIPVLERIPLTLADVLVADLLEAQGQPAGPEVTP